MEVARPRPSRAAKTKAAILVDSDSDSDPKEALKAKKAAPQKRRKPAAAAAVEHAEKAKPAAKPQRKKKQAPASSDDEEAKPAPKPKRKKKKQQQEEDRRTDADGKTVRFREQPSVAVKDRIARTMPGSGHRMFLVDSKEPVGAGDSRSQEFAVLGATGNVYDIKICRNPHCSCPDHAKGNVCKHILFVMLRVLKLAQDNPIVWQKALLASEVEEALSGRQGSDMGAGVLADARVRGAYAAATGGGAGGAAGAAAGADDNQRKPIEGDCPICFDELKAGDEALVWCQAGCGNNMHKKCWDVWAATKRRGGAAVTCVYCRAPWQGAAPAAAAAQDDGDYINLARHSAAHASADTSLEALYGARSAHWINFHRRGY